jgi:hypothetical protein
VTAATPAQAAAHAFVTGCVKRGITASQAAVPPEGQLSTVRGLWADVAQAVVDAATEGALRACGYTLADIGRFLEAETAPPKVHAHPDDLFDAWWDETYEPDEGPQAPDRHVPRDAFRAGWDHARALEAVARWRDDEGMPS